MELSAVPFVVGDGFTASLNSMRPGLPTVDWLAMLMVLFVRDSGVA